MDTYLGGALSAMTTMMCTGSDEERGGSPPSTARTTNMYSAVDDRSSDRASRNTPSVGSNKKALPTLPVKWPSHITVYHFTN